MLEEIKMDYITLVKKSNKILLKTHAKIKKEIRTGHRLDRHTDGGAETGFANMTGDILLEAEMMQMSRIFLGER